MGSLTACLKKAGRNISGDDKALIREIAKDHRGDGLSASDAGMKAVDETLAIAIADRADLAKQIKAKGGAVPPLAEVPESAVEPKPEPKPAPKPASPVQISESDIHPEGAFNGISHTPENHERAWKRGYVDEMTNLWESVEGKITDENRDRVTDAFVKLKDGYSSRLNAFFSAHRRVMSAFVTGPSNFPTRSNEKKSDTADKRMAEANAWLAKGKKRLQKAIRGPIDHSPQSALAQTQSKLKEREETQQKMKAVNAAHKKFLKDPASLSKSNLSEAEKKIIREYNPEYSFHPHPFAPFELTNNNAEIRRLKKRIEELSVKTVKAEEGKKEYSFDGGTVVLDHADDRLRVLFDEKPGAEMRDKLKANGFRWSPRNLSWQRQITEAAKSKATDILGVKFQEQAQDAPAKAERTEALRAPKPTPKPKRIANKDNPELGTNRYSKEEVDLLEAAGMDNPEANHIPMYGDTVPARPANDRITIDRKDIKLPDIDKPMRVDPIFLGLTSIIGPRIYDGKVRGKTTFGFYRQQNGVVRVKNVGEVEVYAHEMAHYLDRHYSHAGRFTAFRQDPKFKESVSLLSYTKNKRLRNSEGFAEMVRVWLTQSDKLEQVAPHVKAEFERILKQDKKLDAGMRRLRRDMHVFYRQGPTGHARSKIGRDESPLIQTKQWMARHSPSLFRQHIIDRYYSASVVEGRLHGKINEAQRSAAKQFQMINGAESVHEAVIEWGTVGLNAAGDGFERTGKSLTEVLKPAARHGYKRVDKFFHYLVGRRARELKGQGRERHFTEQDIKQFLAYGEDLNPDGSLDFVRAGGQHPEFVQMAEEFQAFNQRMLDFYVDMGLITEDQQIAFAEANQDYVPFHRVLDQLAMPPTEQASAAIGKRLYGGPQNIRDTGANIVEGLFANIRASMVARATNTLFADINTMEDGGLFADRLAPDSKLIKPEIDQMVDVISKAMAAVGLGVADGGRIVANEDAAVITDKDDIRTAILKNPMLIAYWSFGHKPKVTNGYIQQATINGEKRWFQVHDALLIDMLTGMGGVKGGVGWNILWFVKNLQTRTVTAALQFLGPNAVRDTSSGYAVSRNAFKPVLTTLVGMGHALFKTKKYWEFMGQGGGYGTRIEARTESSRARKRLDLPSKNAWDVFAKGLAGWDRFTSAFEYGSRIGDYSLGINKGKSKMEAAWEAREITTDFARHGNNEAWVKFMRTVPFLNAGLQGLDKTGRIVATKEGVLSTRNIMTLDHQKAVFLAKVSVFPAISALLYLMFGDEDWYKDRPVDEKARFWGYKFPWMDAPGKIPKPYDISIFANIVESALIYNEQEVGREATKLIAWSLVNTLGIGDYPGILQPFIEVQLNEKFTGAPVVPQYMKDDVEPKYQRRTRTPIMYRQLGESMGVSPLVAEHYSKGFLRYVEHYLVDAVETVFWDEEAHGGRPFARKPVDYVTHQFMGRKVPYRTKYTEQYYDIKNKAARAQGTLRLLKSELSRDREPAVKYAADQMNRQLGTLNRTFAVIDKGLSEKRKEINDHWFDPDLTVPEKETKINAIYSQINAKHKASFLRAEKLLKEAEALKLKLQGEPAK